MPSITLEEQSAVQALLQSLQEHLGGQIIRAFLYGSKARGDGQLWSDIGILITVREESWPLRAEVSTLAAVVCLAYDVPIGPRVVGQKRWRRRREAGFGLYRKITTEGVPLPASKAA